MPVISTRAGRLIGNFSETNPVSSTIADADHLLAELSGKFSYNVKLISLG